MYKKLQIHNYNYTLQLYKILYSKYKLYESTNRISNCSINYLHKNINLHKDLQSSNEKSLSNFNPLPPQKRKKNRYVTHRCKKRGLLCSRTCYSDSSRRRLSQIQWRRLPNDEVKLVSRLAEWQTGKGVSIAGRAAGYRIAQLPRGEANLPACEKRGERSHVNAISARSGEKRGRPSIERTLVNETSDSHVNVQVSRTMVSFARTSLRPPPREEPPSEVEVWFRRTLDVIDTPSSVLVGESRMIRGARTWFASEFYAFFFSSEKKLSSDWLYLCRGNSILSPERETAPILFPARWRVVVEALVGGEKSERAWGLRISARSIN